MHHERADTAEGDVVVGQDPRNGGALMEGGQAVFVQRIPGVREPFAVETRVADDLLALDDHDADAPLGADLVSHLVGWLTCFEQLAGLVQCLRQAFLRERAQAKLDERVFQEQQHQHQRSDRRGDRADQVPAQAATAHSPSIPEQVPRCPRSGH